MTEQRKNKRLQVIDLTDQTFHFEDHGFAVEGFIANDGKRWFSAQTTCKHLGLNDVSRAVSRLPYRDKAIMLLARNGIPVRYLIVTEPGLYRLIFQSKAEAAERYQDWFFDEVLPSIHQYGGYISPTASQEQVDRLIAENRALKQGLDDARQVNRWLGHEQRAGYYLEHTLPRHDLDD